MTPPSQPPSAANRRRRILICTPFPPRLDARHGGKATSQLLLRLAERNEVALLCLCGRDDGHVDWSNDARTYLGALDVFALPSRFEGFPLALLEALLARSAVVAADVGSVAEAVRDGETGLLVPPEDPSALADAIRRLLADTDLRRRLGEQGRELVLGQFTADHMTQAFERLYAELLN